MRTESGDRIDCTNLYLCVRRPGSSYLSLSMVEIILCRSHAIPTMYLVVTSHNQAVSREVTASLISRLKRHLALNGTMRCEFYYTSEFICLDMGEFRLTLLVLWFCFCSERLKSFSTNSGEQVTRNRNCLAAEVDNAEMSSKQYIVIYGLENGVYRDAKWRLLALRWNNNWIELSVI
jgi:hypothetical protein